MNEERFQVDIDPNLTTTTFLPLDDINYFSHVPFNATAHGVLKHRGYNNYSYTKQQYKYIAPLYYYSMFFL